MNKPLNIIYWPDPRLKKTSAAVGKITPELREITDQMFYLMRQSKGVGLAAPQVGINQRFFVMNATGDLKDDRVYINPELSDAEGDISDEEGCLSLPEIRVQVGRSLSLRMKALDLDGQPIDEVASGFFARVWQHETDHLNGQLITDRMGLGDKLKYRRALKEMQAQWDLDHPPAKPAKRPSKSTTTKARTRGK